MADLSGKRILFVITKSNWGGAQSYVYTLATHCRAEGAAVAVALGGTERPGSDTGMLAARLADAGIRVHAIPVLARDLSVLAEWRAFRALLALIRREKPDILHLNSSKAGALGALAGRLARVPRVVFTAHGWAYREPRSLIWKVLVWKASWLTVALSHTVIVVSELDLRTAPVFFPSRKIHLVHNGITAFTLASRVEARKERMKMAPALSETAPLLLMIAELHANKGIDTAIAALARLSPAYPDAALVVLGEGEARESLLQHARALGVHDRVFLPGFVPDARQYLSVADIFLMPSRKEGLPMALLEAGHAALPVVASSVGGIPEIIEHEKNGLRMAPNDPNALADSIVRLLQNPDEARSLGIALERTIHEKFSEQRMLDQTTTLYG